MYNYIDPGTGGIVISSLWGIIAAVLTALAAFIVTYFIRPLRRLVKNIKFLTILVVIIALIIMAASIASHRDSGKVVLLGIDAMDAGLVEKMIAEGKLPNFQRLNYARLQSTVPPETPVAWSAAATGMNPGGYGIYDFITRKGYTPVLTLTEEKRGLVSTSYISGMKGTPLWKIVGDAGIPVTVIKWPVTFPAQAVNGKLLTGLGTVDVRGLLNSYSFYTERNITKGENDVGRVVNLEFKNGTAEAFLYGSLVNGKEAKLPMRIHIGDCISLDINGTVHELDHGWSDWIRVKFSYGLLRDVYGIFKVYISTDPFEMYVTSIQIDPENQLLDITYPKEYGKELVDEIGLFYTMGMPEDTKAIEEGRISKEVFLEQVYQIEAEREKIFWKEFDKSNGLLAFAFDSGDRLQHILWGQKEIEEYYIQKDRFLGKLLDRMGDTPLIIFSDHGFTDFNRSVNINRWLVENGFMSVNGNGMLFDFVNWNETEAYSLGFSSIFVNVKGREPEGIVDNRERVVDEIIEKLRNLTDPETGKKVIVNLYKREDVYSGKYLDDAPDIIIGFEKGYRMSWHNAIGGITDNVFDTNKDVWIGDHLVDRSRVPGVVFANFEIKKQANIIDIAPTVLELFKIKPDMDGENLAV